MSTEESEVYIYQENQRGTRGRFRGPSRGSQRTRGIGERGMQNRGGRARSRPYNTRDPPRDVHRTSGVVPESIDISDSSQWPSIQESATGRVSKRRSRGEKNQNTQDNNISNSVRVSEDGSTHAQTEESYSDQKPTEKTVGNQNNGNLNDQNENSQNRDDRGRINREQGSEYNNSNYQSQPYWYQPRGNRGRTRYSAHPQNRGYQFTYNRRYNRGYSNVYPQHPAPVIPYAPVDTQGIVNGYIPAYPQIVPVLDDKTKEYEAMRQVEYYFSSQNLGNDTFMRGRMDNEGWIDLSLVFRFKRIQRLDMSYDDFMKAVSMSEELDVDKINNRVRTIHNPKQWVTDKSTLEKEKQIQKSENSSNHVKNQFEYVNPQNRSNVQQNSQGQNYPVHQGYPVPPRFYGSFPLVAQPYYPYQFSEGEGYYPYFPGMAPMYSDPNYKAYFDQMQQTEEVSGHSNQSEVGSSSMGTGSSVGQSASDSINVTHKEVEKIVSGISNLKVESSNTTSVPSTVTPST